MHVAAGGMSHRECRGAGAARGTMVGRRVAVYWASEERWYCGEVTAVKRKTADQALANVRVAYEDGEYLAGGGASYAYLSRALKDYADGIGGREQMAIDAFAQALESIPRTLAENAGVDPVDAMIEMRSQITITPALPIYGIGRDGKVRDMVDQQVLEPSRVVTNAIKSSTEAAISILRIDDVLSMGMSTPTGPPMGGM